MPRTPASDGSTFGKSALTKVTPKKGTQSKATTTPGEAKVDQQKVDQYWSREEKEEWKECQSSFRLSIADHEGSNIQELTWRDALAHTSYDGMEVQAVISLQQVEIMIMPQQVVG